MSFVIGAARACMSCPKQRFIQTHVMPLTSSPLKRNTFLYLFLFKNIWASFSYYITDAVKGKEEVN